ncbi:MAG: cofactor-independent phosphoglycerate mutase [Clostridiales bacterium]|nr:cofactor-independent phosphoglycerate mutase [Clostridiales bacterium]
MKYLILVPDGMADWRVPSLDGKTPMEVANKPCMDMLSSLSLCGTVSNVPEGMVPESDTANLSIFSYDPKTYSKGRSPLEAVSMGIDMQPEDTAYRCNFVTLSDEFDYDQKIMVDNSADEISTPEADELIKALNAALSDECRRFYTGVSYRHCLIWKDADDLFPFARPHDIIGQKISEHLPSGETGAPFYRLMRASYDILKDHPVNIERRKKGKRIANSIWLWSPGKKPALPSFEEKWGLRGAVISAVDLLKGIAICAGMTSIDVEGATGNIHTNYKGKADAAIRAFKEGYDLVYIHVEAPDEAGHRGEVENKCLSIEYIDEQILRPVYDYLHSSDEPYKILVLPDHPTPLEIRTHSKEPVPFFLYNSSARLKGVSCFTEETAKSTGYHIPDGCDLIGLLTDA